MTGLLSPQALPTSQIVVPVLGACVLLAAGRYLPRWLVDGFATAVTLAGVALAALAVAATSGGRVVEWSGGWQPKPGLTVGVVLVVDRANAGIALLIAVLATCALVFGWRYFEDVRAHYHALVLLFVAGMTGFVLTGDLFDMFVFFELMGASAYALAAFKIEDAEAVQGGLTFAVINSLGAYLGLVGIGLLYARTGQLGLPQLGSALASHGADPVVLTGFTLVCTGWLVKAAAVPWHFWLADAHAVAPAPICVLFSGVMAPLGVYGVTRLYWTAFRGVLPDAAVHRALLVLGVATAVLGALMCWTQRHIKRLLAYSTIAHTGMFLIGLAAVDAEGILGDGLYLVGHAAVKGALFLLAGALLSRYESVDERQLFGAATAHRAAGAAFALGGLALAGLPPFGLGLGKSVLDHAGHSTALTVLGIAVSAVTGGAVLRVALRVYFGVGPRPDVTSDDDEVTGQDEQPDARPPRERTPVSMSAAIALLFAVGLATGVVPGFATATARAAAQFVDQRGYLDAALRGVQRAVPPVSFDWWGVQGVVLGFVAVGCACGVAVLGAYQPRLPAPVRRPAEWVAPVIGGLHRLHSGHIGDYAAWLVFGSAALAGLLAL
ncbi:MAG TPA: complex I subunit 5 family protein [Pseudonocardiaceae bacterium]|nr:complex I subunit 5 family protein [Pseudonocardiaceae bacterium]